MCKQLCKNGMMCKIRPELEYCHIHKKNEIIKVEIQIPPSKLASDYAYENICLTDKIAVKDMVINRIKENNKYLRSEIERLENNTKDLLVRQSSMQLYYDNYQKILKFEDYKQKVYGRKLSPTELDKYISLRDVRNKLCHPFQANTDSDTE